MTRLVCTVPEVSGWEVGLGRTCAVPTSTTFVTTGTKGVKLATEVKLACTLDTLDSSLELRAPPAVTTGRWPDAAPAPVITSTRGVAGDVGSEK